MENLKEKQIKEFQAEIKSINDKDFTAEIFISDGSVDRHGDIVEPEAIIDGKKNFMKNPVLINSHNYGDVNNILGKFKEISIDGKKVSAKVEYFVGQGNPAADWAFACAKNKVAAFSIGFMAKEYEVMKDKAGNSTGYKFKALELLEVSQVAVPANPHALIKSFEILKNKVEDAKPKPAAEVNQKTISAAKGCDKVSFGEIKNIVEENLK